MATVPEIKPGSETSELDHTKRTQFQIWFAFAVSIAVFVAQALLDTGEIGADTFFYKLLGIIVLAGGAIGGAVLNNRGYLASRTQIKLAQLTAAANHDTENPPATKAAS